MQGAIDAGADISLLPPVDQARDGSCWRKITLPEEQLEASNSHSPNMSEWIEQLIRLELAIW